VPRGCKVVLYLGCIVEFGDVGVGVGVGVIRCVVWRVVEMEAEVEVVMCVVWGWCVVCIWWEDSSAW
jgi:hypothetical protein